MTTITITLRDDLEAFIKRFGEKQGLSPEEAALELIRRNARVDEMDTLRGKMAPYFDKAGVESEEDVIRLVDDIRDKPSAA